MPSRRRQEDGGRLGQARTAADLSQSASGAGLAAQRGQSTSSLGDAMQVDLSGFGGQLRQPAQRRSLIVLRVGPLEDEQDGGGFSDADTWELSGRCPNDRRIAGSESTAEALVGAALARS
jgi:hypothetical protein